MRQTSQLRLRRPGQTYLCRRWLLWLQFLWQSKQQLCNMLQWFLSHSLVRIPDLLSMDLIPDLQIVLQLIRLLVPSQFPWSKSTESKSSEFTESPPVVPGLFVEFFTIGLHKCSASMGSSGPTPGPPKLSDRFFRPISRPPALFSWFSDHMSFSLPLGHFFNSLSTIFVLDLPANLGPLHPQVVWLFFVGTSGGPPLRGDISVSVFPMALIFLNYSLFT